MVILDDYNDDSIAACKMETVVAGTLPEGGKCEVRVRVAAISAFPVMKGFAHFGCAVRDIHLHWAGERGGGKWSGGVLY
jgi:hypothetical protein